MERRYKIPFTLFFLTGNLASFISNAQTTRMHTRSTFPCEAPAPSSITMTTEAPNDLTVCGSTQWHFDVDYTDGDLYQWKILDPAMGSIVSGNNSPHIEVLFNNPTGPSEDVQVVVAVTKCNERRRDTLTMYVTNPPEYAVSSTENRPYEVSCGKDSLYDITLFRHTDICPGEVRQIKQSFAYSNDGGASWHPIPTLGSALSVNIQLPAGDYQLREIIYSNQNTAAPPCTSLVDLHLPDKPHADFDFEAPYYPACLTDVVIQFKNQSTPDTGLTYVWDFGEGPTNFQKNPGKVFIRSGIGVKTVILTATNTMGCTARSECHIEIMDNENWDWQHGVKPELVINPPAPHAAGTKVTLYYFNMMYGIPSKYTWYKGNTPISPASGSSSIEVTQPGWYWVMGSDAYGCLVPSYPTWINFEESPDTSR